MFLLYYDRYYECVEFYRRLILIMLVTLFEGYFPITTLCACLLISIIYLGIQSFVQPYKDPADDTFNGLSYMVLSLILSCVITLKALASTSSDGENNAKPYLALACVIPTCLLMLLAMYEIAAVVVAAGKQIWEACHKLNPALFHHNDIGRLIYVRGEDDAMFCDGAGLCSVFHPEWPDGVPEEIDEMACIELEIVDVAGGIDDEVFVVDKAGRKSYFMNIDITDAEEVTRQDFIAFAGLHETEGDEETFIKSWETKRQSSRAQVVHTKTGGLRSRRSPGGREGGEGEGGRKGSPKDKKKGEDVDNDGIGIVAEKSTSGSECDSIVARLGQIESSMAAFESSMAALDHERRCLRVRLTELSQTGSVGSAGSESLVQPGADSNVSNSKTTIYPSAVNTEPTSDLSGGDLIGFPPLPPPALSTEENLRAVFKALDFDNTGMLSKDQFCEILTMGSGDSNRLTEDELERIYSEVDCDNSGFIDIEEYVAWAKRGSNPQTQHAAGVDGVVITMDHAFSSAPPLPPPLLARNPPLQATQSKNAKDEEKKEERASVLQQAAQSKSATDEEEKVDVPQKAQQSAKSQVTPVAEEEKVAVPQKAQQSAKSQVTPVAEEEKVAVPQKDQQSAKSQVTPVAGEEKVAVPQKAQQSAKSQVTPVAEEKVAVPEKAQQPAKSQVTPVTEDEKVAVPQKAKQSAKPHVTPVAEE
jgi:hypothetical protein